MRAYWAVVAVLVAVTSLAVASCCGGTGQGRGAGGAENPSSTAAEGAVTTPPAPPVVAPGPVVEPMDGPACDAEALRPVVEGSEAVAAGLAFELTGIHCAEGFARATLQPAGEGDGALVLFRAVDASWSLLDLGTGIECPVEGVPEALCGELVAGPGETASP